MERDKLILSQLEKARMVVLSRYGGKDFLAIPGIDDLISAAYEGLIDAAEHFSTDKGLSFGNYAEIKIKGKIIDELRKFDPLTRYARRVTKRLEASLSKLRGEKAQHPCLEVHYRTLFSW